MEITARKKSNDPVQEALRTHKDKWNLAAKEFIARVIAFKRALNGRGDNHYGLPVSNIKDALPDQIGAFLNTLTSNYEQLAAEALRIEQEQAAYSQNRQKPKEKGPEVVVQGPPTESKVASASKNTAEVKIGNHVLPALLAISEEDQARGLMGKAWPPPVMAFVYSTPQVNRFWMKSTPSPLDIVFSLNGKITQICKGEPNSTRMIGDYAPSDLVVELPFGTCASKKITVGQEIKILDWVDRLENKYSAF